MHVEETSEEQLDSVGASSHDVMSVQMNPRVSWWEAVSRVEHKLVISYVMQIYDWPAFA